jgi:DNA polymerase-3 subunit gamma/tau
VLHAADMPDPGTLAKQLGELAANGVGVGANGGPAPGAPPIAKVDWAELCETVDRAGMLRVAGVMRDWIRVIELAPGQLRFAPAPGFSDDPSAELRDALFKATGQRWLVERGEGEGTPTLREQAEAAKAAEAERIRKTPLVEAALAAFPGAEIVDEAEVHGGRGEKNWSRAS